MRHVFASLSVFIAATGLVGCSTSPEPVVSCDCSPAEDHAQHAATAKTSNGSAGTREAAFALMQENAEAARAGFVELDSSLARHLEEAHAYVVFPAISRGGVGIGGVSGRGIVYQNGEAVGVCEIIQGAADAEFGGQSFSQLVIFRDEQAFERLDRGNFNFAARDTASAVTAGAADDAEYERGVAAFSMAAGGLMYQAALGGQRFTVNAL